MVKDKAMEFKNGLMELFTKVNGKTTKPMEKVSSPIPMAITMMVSGPTIKPRVEVFTNE